MFAKPISLHNHYKVFAKAFFLLKVFLVSAEIGMAVGRNTLDNAAYIKHVLALIMPMTPRDYAGKYRNLKVYVFSDEQAAKSPEGALPQGGAGSLWMYIVTA